MLFVLFLSRTRATLRRSSFGPFFAMTWGHSLPHSFAALRSQSRCFNFVIWICDKMVSYAASRKSPEACKVSEVQSNSCEYDSSNPVLKKGGIPSAIA